MILHFLQYLLMLKALYTSYLLLPTSYFLPPTWYQPFTAPMVRPEMKYFWKKG